MQCLITDINEDRVFCLIIVAESLVNFRKQPTGRSDYADMYGPAKNNTCVMSKMTGFLSVAYLTQKTVANNNKVR